MATYEGVPTSEGLAVDEVAKGQQHEDVVDEDISTKDTTTPYPKQQAAEPSIDPSTFPDLHLVEVASVSIPTTDLVVFASLVEKYGAQRSLDIPSIEGDGVAPPSAEALPIEGVAASRPPPLGSLVDLPRVARTTVEDVVVEYSLTSAITIREKDGEPARLEKENNILHEKLELQSHELSTSGERLEIAAKLAHQSVG
ncbi:hypothetical protein GUJ93_ZPchr0011g28700 [Zizania palustris]|uniref:Uncharacterized protein n=1 Tax=Zizania palustris TaxID=103762 RepID=A0A8J5WF71_ZIZPA|nr:hypothetical protein GUJ93_ZPchr0011g28700 [Zizania palustris]